MKLAWSVAGAAVLACSGGIAAAADFDGSKPLVCANVEAVECDAAGEGDCKRSNPAAIDAPMFLRIDFAKKVIVGRTVTTPIARMEENAGQLLLQGSELEFGWTMALDTTTGMYSTAITDREGVITLFGACTPL
jgi:hypothetical protein